MYRKLASRELARASGLIKLRRWGHVHEAAELHPAVGGVFLHDMK